MNDRKTEILINGEWTPSHFSGIRKGRKFRLFEPTGEPVVSDSKTDFTALGDAYLNENGIWCVESNY